MAPSTHITYVVIGRERKKFMTRCWPCVQLRLTPSELWLTQKKIGINKRNWLYILCALVLIKSLTYLTISHRLANSTSTKAMSDRQTEYIPYHLQHLFFSALFFVWLRTDTYEAEPIEIITRTITDRFHEYGPH